MISTGVVVESEGVTGDYKLHVPFTLPQVSGTLQIEGVWPERVTIRRGWARAHARPWNESSTDATVRLDRGSASFLNDASEWVADVSGGNVYSPALYPTTTRVWSRASYQPFLNLDVMERMLRRLPERSERVVMTATPDLDSIAEIDRASFDDFWHMSKEGLEEALTSTANSVVFETYGDRGLNGYAIVGAQMGTGYLQRIAVHPDDGRKGLGSDLIAEACHWAKAAGCGVLVLNVKPENMAARALYLGTGFSESTTQLRVLRYDSQ